MEKIGYATVLGHSIPSGESVGCNLLRMICNVNGETRAIRIFCAEKSVNQRRDGRAGRTPHSIPSSPRGAAAEQPAENAAHKLPPDLAANCA